MSDTAGTDQVVGDSIGAGAIARALELPPPTAEQTRVIEHPPTSLLVVAGAGSGKTETMAARVVWLVANGHVAPADVLGLTFTRKAAGELAERLGRRLRRLRSTGLWSPPQAPRSMPDDGFGFGAVGASAVDASGEFSPTISTYHAYAGRLLRDHGVRLAVETDSRLLTPAAAWQLAHEAVTAYDGPLDGLDAAESTVTHAVLALSAELAEHLSEPSQLEAVLARIDEHVARLPLGGRRRAVPAQVAALLAHGRAQRAMLPLLERYAESKAQRDCLDFADQMALAARLAIDHADVATAERARHKVVLLDEFQDTSEAQLRLLHALFGASGPVARGGPGEPVPVMAVGDPHQSIYGWRGASATTLTAFATRFGTTGAATPCLPLSTSWRNDVAILQAANAVARPLTAHSQVHVARLVPAPSSRPGRVEALRASTHLDEAQHVADWIARRWWTSDGEHCGASAAVLCRRRAQFPAIVAALRERDLPVEVVGVGGLLLTPEVGDLHALLGVAADPARGDTLMRLLCGPAVHLGAADLDGLAAWSRQLQHRKEARGAAAVSDIADPENDDGCTAQEGTGAGQRSVESPVSEVHDAPSLIDAVHRLPPEQWRGPRGQWISAAARRRIDILADAIAAVRRAADAPLSQIVRSAEQALGLDVEVMARPGISWGSGRVHLDAFLDVARDFEAAADRPGLDGFLAWLEVARSEERGLETPASHASQDSVQVLTVHAAKGLEWDVVAIPGLIEGAFPDYRFGRSTPAAGAWRLAPAKDRGWITGLDRIPYELRGDASALPLLDWRSSPTMDDLETVLEDFAAQGGQHIVEEERRLAYVAITRARHEVLLSCSVWAQGGTPRVTSRFVTELVGQRSGPDGRPESSPGAATGSMAAVHVSAWGSLPPADDPAVVNPLQDQAPTLRWPVDDPAQGGSLARHERSAAQVRDARGRSPSRDAAEELDGLRNEGLLDEQTWALLAEADLLLDLRATRDEPRTPGRRGEPRCQEAPWMPGHLSTSALVRFAEDPQTFVADLRRPVPVRPSRARRSGTELHRWIEQHYGRASIVDLDELPGSADDDHGPDVADAKARFLASEWAQRQPLAVELPVETIVDGVPIRGRIDAVFPAPDGSQGVVIVDWKASRPVDGDRLRARTLQLSAYRVAYARLSGLPVEQVAVAFYHAATGRTVYPPQPRDPEADLRRHIVSLRADQALDAPGSPASPARSPSSGSTASPESEG